MVDEAAFASHVRDWPGNKNDLEWVLKQLSRALANTVVLPPTEAHQILEAAQRRAEEVEEEWEAEQRRAEEEGDDKTYEWWRSNSGREFRDVRAVLKPVLELLPDDTEYLAALEQIAPDLRAPALKAGYNKTTADPERDDFWAWEYLGLMKYLGETEVLLGILKDRLITIPAYQYPKAYDATWQLAKSVLKGTFYSWFEREVGEWPEPPSHW